MKPLEKLIISQKSSSMLTIIGTGLSQVFKAIHWFLEGVTGGPNPYEKYMEHQRIHHPDSPIKSQKEFWDEYWEKRDNSVEPSCC